MIILSEFSGFVIEELLKGMVLTILFLIMWKRTIFLFSGVVFALLFSNPLLNLLLHNCYIAYFKNHLSFRDVDLGNFLEALSRRLCVSNAAFSSGIWRPFLISCSWLFQSFKNLSFYYHLPFKDALLIEVIEQRPLHDFLVLFCTHFERNIKLLFCGSTSFLNKHVLNFFVHTCYEFHRSFKKDINIWS